MTSETGPRVLDVATGAGGLATADMVLNIGPQHPATHGVLRLRVVLDGERIVTAEPQPGRSTRTVWQTGRGARCPRTAGCLRQEKSEVVLAEDTGKGLVQQR